MLLLKDKLWFFKSLYYYISNNWSLQSFSQSSYEVSSLTKLTLCKCFNAITMFSVQYFVSMCVNLTLSRCPPALPLLCPGLFCPPIDKMKVSDRNARSHWFAKPTIYYKVSQSACFCSVHTSGDPHSFSLCEEDSASALYYSWSMTFMCSEGNFWHLEGKTHLLADITLHLPNVQFPFPSSFNIVSWLMSPFLLSLYDIKKVFFYNTVHQTRLTSYCSITYTAMKTHLYCPLETISVHCHD